MPLLAQLSQRELCTTNLLSLVTTLIQKQDSCLRHALASHERLATSLPFLATGRTSVDFKFSAMLPFLKH